MKKNNILISVLVVFLSLGLFSSLSAQEDTQITDNKVNTENIGEKGLLEVYLFYSPHCKACLKLKKEFLPKILEEYKGKIVPKSVNILNKKNLETLNYLVKYYKRDKALVPSLLVGNSFIVGTIEAKEKLREVIDKNLAEKRTKPFVFNPQEKSYIEEIFHNISLFALVSAGLIDGVNPCAFAVIIFFISFLLVYGFKNKEVIAIGICYILSIFIAYVLIGLGIFNFLFLIEKFYLAIKIFYYSIAVFCFFLAGCAVYDIIQYKKTKETSGMLLQLPESFKKKINFVIGKAFRGKKGTSLFRLCLFSFAVGFVVSLLEAVCTGQIYIPTIALILKSSQSLRLKAFSYLLLYNLMFVLPLVAVLLLAVFGYKAAQFNNFLRNRLVFIKVLMVIIFVGLGLIMLILN